MAGRYYSGSFTQREVCSKGDVTLLPGVYNLIGEVVVKADEKIGLGRGASVTQSEAIGRFFAIFKDKDGNEIENGKFRCMLMSSQDIPLGGNPIAIDVDLIKLMTGELIPSDRYPFPFNNTMLTKDRKYQFYIMNYGDTAVELDSAASRAIMDVTREIV